MRAPPPPRAQVAWRRIVSYRGDAMVVKLQEKLGVEWECIKVIRQAAVQRCGHQQQQQQGQGQQEAGRPGLSAPLPPLLPAAAAATPPGPALPPGAADAGGGLGLGCVPHHQAGTQLSPCPGMVAELSPPPLRPPESRRGGGGAGKDVCCITPGSILRGSASAKEARRAKAVSFACCLPMGPQPGYREATQQQ